MYSKLSIFEAGSWRSKSRFHMLVDTSTETQTTFVRIGCVSEIDGPSVKMTP